MSHSGRRHLIQTAICRASVFVVAVGSLYGFGWFIDDPSSETLARYYLMMIFDRSIWENRRTSEVRLDDERSGGVGVGVGVGSVRY